MQLPRFAAYGGLVVFAFPFQDIDDAELAANIDFHRESYMYLLEPVQQRLLDLAASAGYTKGRKARISTDISTASLKGKLKLQRLGLKDREASFDAYTSSRLAVMNLG